MTKVSQKEIQVLEKQASPLIQEAESYSINSVEDVEKASVFLKKLRDTERMVEAKRLEITKPLNKSLRAINASFKSVSEPLATARKILTVNVVTWKTLERERLEKEEARRRKIQEAHEKKGHEVKAPVVLDMPDNKIGNTQTRKVWTFDVVDFSKLPDEYKVLDNVVDFSKLPDEYKVLDNVTINQAIRNGAREIKGLKIFQEEKLSIVGR